jgi:uncharacterized repeat protein (TIGR01451 family)
MAGEAMEARVLLATVQWVSDSDGFWDDAVNWQDQSTLANRVPGSGDQIVINRPGSSVTVTLRNGFGVQNAGQLTLAADESLRITGEGLILHQSTTTNGDVILAGGFLQAHQPVTLGGQTTWTAGSLHGQFLIAAGGTMEISGSSDVGLAASVTNLGKVIQSGSGDVIDIASGQGSVWTNAAGSIYEFSGDGGQNRTANFNNQGTVKKSAGTGESSFTDRFNNMGGTVEVTQGTLKLTRGSNTGGTYIAAAGAILDMTGGFEPTYSGTLTGAGTGRVELSNGVMNTADSGATLDFPVGLFHWTGGNLSSGTARPWRNVGVLQISGDTDKSISAVVRNSGTVIHSGSGDVIDVASGQGSTWFNLAGSVYEFSGDGGRQGTSTFNNLGTVRKSAGSGESFLTQAFNNTGGILESLSGRLTIAGTSGYWQDAIINASGTGVVGLAAQASVTGSFTGGGTGRLELAGGRLNSVSDGGTRPRAIFDFPQEFFHWTGGAISGNGLTNKGSLTVSPLISGPVLDGGTLINEGLIQHIGPGLWNLNGNLLHNRAGGVLEIDGDLTLLGRNQFGGRGTLQNDGVIRKISGVGTAVIDAILAGGGGVVENQTGRLQFSSGGNSTGMTFNVAAGTEIQFNGGSSENVDWTGTHTGMGAGRVSLNAILRGIGVSGARLDFAPNVLHITGGQILDYVINDGTLQFSTTDGVFARARIVNNGTWIHTGTGDFVLNANSRFENLGLVDLQTDADLVVPGDASGGAMYFFNAGILRKSGGTGTTAFRHDGSNKELAFDNTGTVDVQTGTLSFNDRVIQAQGATLTDGTWAVHAFATLTIPSAGALTINRAHIILDGPGSTFTNLTNLSQNQGSFSLLGGRDFATTGHLTNNGKLSVGPGSVLTVGGNLTESVASSLVGLWRGDGNALDSSGNNRHGSVLGSVPIVPGRFSDSFQFNGQHNVVSLGNPTALRLQDFTISAWIRREDLTDQGAIFAYGQSGYGFGVLPNGRLWLSHIGFSHVESPTLAVTDAAFHHVAVTKSGGTITFSIDGRQEVVFGYFPNFSFSTNAAIGGVQSDGSPSSSFLGRIDEVAVFNRALRPEELAVVAANADVPNRGRSIPSLEVAIGGRPATNEFGKIVISGQASLTGTLDVTRRAGFGPVQGDSYEPITFTGRTGNFSAIYGLSPYFSATMSGTNVVIHTDRSAGNLSVEAIAVTSGPVAVSGQVMQVEYTVRNEGTEALSSAWQDTLFLSTDAVLSADDVLLARIDRTTGLAAGATYTQTVSATTPGLVDDHYYVIVVANANKTIPEADRLDNVRTTSTRTAIQLPHLTFALTTSAVLLPGQPQYFRLSVPAEVRDVAVGLSAALGATGAIELYAGRGRLPGSADFEFASGELNSPNASLLISEASADDYFITVFPRRLSGPVSFELKADVAQLTVSSVTPAVAGAGIVTFHIRGANLRDDDLVELVSSTGIRFPATSLSREDSGHLFATFNLTSAAAGAFSLAVIRAGNQLSLPSAVTVEARREPVLTSSLDLPIRFRIGLVFNGAVEYRNTGNVDMPAPLLVLSTNGEGQLRLGRTDEFTAGNLVLVAASQQGPAGVLRPGESWRIPVQILSPVVGELSVLLDYQTADATNSVNWIALEASVRPAGIADADWNPFWLPFKAEAGNTIGGYVALMARYSEELQARGGQFHSGADVLRLAMRDLYERAHASIAGQIFLDDATHPLVGAQVIATSVAGTAAASRASIAVRTDSEGRFHLPELPPGTYNITVPGYQQLSPVTVTVTGSAPVLQTSLTVRRGGVIKGVVRSESNSVSLAGLPVVLSGASQTWAATTDSRGRFEFTGVPDGIWNIEVGDEHWAVRKYQEIEIDSPARVRDLVIEVSPAASLTGLVRANGSVAARVQIEVKGLDRRLAVNPVITNAAGQYFITGLNPGSWRIVATRPGFAPSEQVISIVSGSSTTLPDFDLQAGASINFTVEDALENPVNKAVLEFRQNGQLIALESTPANGRISLRDLAPGTFDVIVKATGLLTTTTSITLSAGMNSRTLTLAKAGAISGIVRSSSGDPIPRMIVRLSGFDADNNEVVASVTTAPDGTYSFEGIRYGTFAVTVGNGPGILRQDTTIATGSIARTLNFTLAGARILGSLVESNGVTPIADATVVLSHNGAVLATAVTDADGKYVFRSLQAGNYVLQGAGSTGVSQRMEVSVAANSTTSAPALQAGTHSLSGTIRFAGVPVSGAGVLLTPLGAGALGQYFVTTTGIDGTYAFTGLAAQDYQLRVEAPDRVIVSETVSVSSGAAHDVALQNGFRVTGTITSSGNGVSEATVIYIDQATHRVLGADTTDDTGFYEIDDIPDGTFTVLVHHAGYATLNGRGIIVDAGSVVHDLSVSLQSTSVTGALTDDSGSPIANATVDFVDANGQTVITVVSGFDGKFSTLALPAGTYTTIATLVGYFPTVAPGLVLNAGVPVISDLFLQTAGTDDSVFADGPDDYASGAVGDYLKSRNPRPKRDPIDYFVRIPFPGPDVCAEKLDAWFRMDAAERNKEAAWESWIANHENYNSTVNYSAAIFAVQMANTMASIVALMNGSAMAQALATASGAQQATVMLSQMGVLFTQLQKVYKAGKEAIHSGSGKSILDFGKNMFKLLDEAGEVTHLIDSIGKTSHHLHLPFHLPFGLVVAIANVVDLMKETAASAQALDNLGNTVTDAQDRYLSALDQYLARREHYGRVRCSPDDPPEPDPRKPGPRARLTNRQSGDPNEKEAGSINGSTFVRAGEFIDYTIHFENMATATAPAQLVIITDVLDSNLDLSTLELGQIGFNGVTVNVPKGRQVFEGVTFVDTDSNPVRVTASLDVATRTLTFSMMSLDPETQQLTEDPDAGFLPPNDAANRGQGFVTFRVRTVASTANGTMIPNAARIVFDINAPIDTPTIQNIVDAAAPMGTIAALPSQTHGTNITLNWAGADPDGSGVDAFDIYYSVDNGPWQALLAGTRLTTTQFTGTIGRTYRFFSIATDVVGLREPYVEAAEATTTLVPAAVPVLTTMPTTTFSQTPAISWGPAAGAASYDIWVSNLGTNTSGIIRTIVSSTSFIPSSSLGIGRFRVWVRSLDASGNASAWSLPVTFNVNTPVTLHSIDRYQSTARPTLSWDSLPGAIHYDLWINNLTTGQAQFVRNAALTSTSWTADVDFPMGRYYAWVQGIDAGGIRGAWSTAVYFVSLPRPVASSPIGGTFSRTPQFAWNAVPGATRYVLTVVNSNTGSTVLQQTITSGTTFTPGSSIADGPYRWWVYGMNNENFATIFSVPVNIYVGGRTSLVNPASDTHSTRPVFSWQPVVGAARYELWVDRVGSSSDKVRETQLTQTEYTPAVPLSQGTYRVWIRAISNSGEASPWSIVREFRIIAENEHSPNYPSTLAESSLLSREVLTSLFKKELLDRPHSPTRPFDDTHLAESAADFERSPATRAICNSMKSSDRTKLSRGRESIPFEISSHSDFESMPHDLPDPELLDALMSERTMLILNSCP